MENNHGQYQNKKTTKNIYTVIIIDAFDYEGFDVSTVSFSRFSDAVKYCLDEIGDEDAKDALKEEMYYTDGDTKYYIEEAKLITTTKKVN